MDPSRLDDAADPADLDVDDPAAPHLQGRPDRVAVEGALVETERRLDLPLQLGVVPEVVGRERLLDHEQVEGVEPPERLRVLQGIGAVGVDLEHDVGEGLADGRAGRDVPARFDLDLDPLVAFVQEPADLGDQVGERVLDAAADPGLDLGPRPAVKFAERHPRLLGLEVPEGQLEPGLGHRVAPEGRGLAGEVLGLDDALAENERDEELLHDVPGRLGRLAAVEGGLLGDALAPAADAVLADLDQAEGPVVGAPEARLEEMDIGEPEQVDLDPFDGHRRSSVCANPA